MQQEHWGLGSEESEESHTDRNLSLEEAQLGNDNETDSGTTVSVFQEEQKGEPDNPACCGGKVVTCKVGSARI